MREYRKSMIQLHGRWLTYMLCVAVVGLIAVSPMPAHASYKAHVAKVFDQQMRLAGTRSGAMAIDLDSGAEIYTNRADLPRTPASVEKLYTSAVALLRFGAKAKLLTQALSPAAPDAQGVLHGNLYLRGSGDPTISIKRAATLAANLRRAGVKSVTGSVVGDDSEFDALRGPPSSGFRVSGDVGPLSALIFNRGRSGSVFQSSPATFAAGRFTELLRSRGVAIAGRARTGTTPLSAGELSRLRSPSIAQIIQSMNVPSDNFIAETLIKALGSHFGLAGKTAAGASVIRSVLGSLGLHPTVVDGSGLSRGNRTTPREVVALLQQMAERPAYSAFDDSLPVAGRNGTLRGRMRNTAAANRCHAKTGTLNSVSSLAGYCTTVTGRHVAFAFLMNQINVARGRFLQDRMVMELARL